MFSTLFLISFVSFSASAVAQSSVVCIAGQCLQGFSNATIGTKLSASGTSVLLLPGEYTSTTNPQFLHNLLTSSSAALTSSPGFDSNATVTLPLNVNLKPGLAIYSSPRYSGSSAFLDLPAAPIANTSTPLNANAILFSTNVWAAVSSGSDGDRVVLWDAIPDVSQLPSGASRQLALLDIQSSACSPPCSGSGVCSVSGTCTCPTGFTGSSCETCAEGFFGPNCQPCPANCSSCDQGISGSGRCLTPIVTNAPSTCNCLNGQCQPNGQCTCNPGWLAGTNGTACAKCAPGFFLTSTGDCKVCQLGCSNCADTTATCISCQQGFTQDANDNTKCNALPPKTTDNITCPDGSFVNGNACAVCSPSCTTCNGPSSNDCIICSAAHTRFNGNCVATDNNGVCEGTNGMVADNVKRECETCGAKCTACKIPNFTLASTINQAQCTGCLPGFLISGGSCVASCPSGTFVSPQDNLTCIACSSSCGTCIGTADFCLTCNSGQLASSGQCVSTCPSNTFTSSGSCLKCHPDCASCSGQSFNQCSTCPPDRPVLTNGRCLPTCSKSQFFDKTSSSCQPCDSSCSSCSGPGSSNCLACSSATQILRAGSCVSANCNGSSSVIPGLGVCLSELVEVPSATGTAAPLPSITGLSDPTTITKRRPLAWWEILLMALGCAFIFVVIVMLFRRRAKKQREKRTAMFASAKRLDNPRTWRERLVRFGERFFGHRSGNRLQKDKRDVTVLPVAYNHHDRHLSDPISSRPHSVASYSQDIKLKKIVTVTPKDNDRSKRRESEDVDDLIDSYAYSTYTRSSRSPSTLPGLEERRNNLRHKERRIDRDSLYSEVTGNQRHTPEPRQSLKRNVTGASNISRNTINTYKIPDAQAKEGVLVDIDEEHSTPAFPLQMASNTGSSTKLDIINNNYYGLGTPTSAATEAQVYAMAVRPGLTHLPLPTFMPVGPTMTGGSFMPIPVTLSSNSNMGPGGSYWLTPLGPHPTGGSQSQQEHPSVDTVVLQPMNTGGSSRNPFRQQGLY